MNRILSNILQKFAALALALGSFQIMALGTFKNFQGILYWSPLILLFAIFLYILNKTFNGRRKFDGVFLILLIILGFTSASFWGHKTLKYQVNQPGVIKVE